MVDHVPEPLARGLGQLLAPLPHRLQGLGGLLPLFSEVVVALLELVHLVVQPDGELDGGDEEEDEDSDGRLLGHVKLLRDAPVR